jgi:hypothetical protein
MITYWLGLHGCVVLAVVGGIGFVIFQAANIRKLLLHTEQLATTGPPPSNGMLLQLLVCHEGVTRVQLMLALALAARTVK